MARKNPGNSMILTPDKAPSLLDCFGKPIKVGDLIAYPVRNKSEMWMVPAVVRGWDFRKVVDRKSSNHGEVFCNLRVWILSDPNESGERQPRKSVLNAIYRIVKLDHDIANHNSDLQQLLACPPDPEMPKNTRNQPYSVQTV